MAEIQFFELGRVKGKNGILVAMQHNKRTLQAEYGASGHIDASKIKLNYTLFSIADTPSEIDTRSKVLIAEAGLSDLRKDAVRAVEAVFSLPADRHKEDTTPFFRDCLEWTQHNFKGVLLSFDVHLDESAPHAHAIILPLIDGKMQGSDMIGNRFNLMRLQELFYTNVAIRHGLSMLCSKRLSTKNKQKITTQVLACLKDDPVMKSKAWRCFRNSIVKNPIPYAQILEIKYSAQPVRQKSFVDIKRSKGKGSFIT